MTETAFKCVTSELRSPFIHWRTVDHDDPTMWGDAPIVYEIGGDFDAQGIAVCGVTGVPLSDPVNAFRGVMAYPTLDSFWLRPYGVDPKPLPGGPRPDPLGPTLREQEIPVRYLQLSYELDDLLGACVEVPTGSGNWQPYSGMLPRGLSLARVHVVAEVFP